jgi:ABC-type dipeptide/oligopeptide/nickel transport system permease component
LIQGLLVIITLGVLGANFIVDMVYVLLDPTVRRP